MNTLAEIIAAAFADVPKPVGLRAIAPYVCEECDELAADFTPYDFRSLPGSLIEAQYSGLPLLSPEALHHYLPAYMIYALSCDLESNIPDFTVYHLVPSEESLATSPGYFRARFDVFSEAQRAAICLFLEHVYRNRSITQPSLQRAKVLWPNVA